jgi:Recombination directionality factor-like
MALKNLMPQLAERGKIKIGEKGEQKTSQAGKTFGQPKKLDHFVVTTLQRDSAGRLLPDTALMSKLQKNGSKLTEIPVRLLYDDLDLNFLTRYACYRGARCWCSGDGEKAQQGNDKNGSYQSVPCPCERMDAFYTGQDRCKILGTLQVLIEGTERIGGVWKFRTTSWNSVNAILSSLTLIKAITGGPLAGIPLKMVLLPKTVTVPLTGQPMIVYVVSLEYWGSETNLAELGYSIARKRLEHQVRMEQIEEQARLMLASPQQEPLEEQVETAEEFFPDSVVAEMVAQQVAATPGIVTQPWDDEFLVSSVDGNGDGDGALTLSPPKAEDGNGNGNGTISPALVRQIEHQAKIKGVEVPQFTTADEAKAALKQLMG